MNMQVACHTMIATPLVYSGFSGSQASKPPASPSCFEPLDPDILNASIPAFYIGRNTDGFWLARDARGESGGAFLLKSSALVFAKRMSRPKGCATIFLYERFELDLENQGNPLVGYLKPLMRLAMAGWRRTVAVTGWIARDVRH
jgi:hypothetical protein